MILQCPSCQTKYNFPEDKYREGRKVKCTICSNVFTLPPLQAPEPEEPLFDSAAEDDLDALFGEAAAKPDQVDFESEAEEEAPPPRGERGASRVKDEFNLDGDSGSKGRSIDLDSMLKQERKGKGLKAGLLVGVLLLGLLGGGGWWYFTKFKTEAPAPEPETADTSQIITTEQIKHFSLEDVKQFYVDNDKVGKLFVVQGKVVNNFTVPKELIKIEANLFDAAGSSVVSKSQLIGNTVSLFQLQMLSQEELESAINNKVGILTANTNVPPSGEVPFVVVFYNPPDSVQEFGIKVVGAKDPPKQ